MKFRFWCVRRQRPPASPTAWHRVPHNAQLQSYNFFYHITPFFNHFFDRYDFYAYFLAWRQNNFGHCRVDMVRVTTKIHHIMSKLLTEFKEFAMRGNVVDMAVGVVVGGAFGKIVTSLVNDIIMPGIGVLTGGLNFSEYKYVIKDAVIDGATSEVITPEVALTWGAFVQTIVDFIIIAFCIFLAIKVMNNLRKKEEAAPEPEPAPAEPSDEVKLLTEIRDLLNKDSK